MLLINQIIDGKKTSRFFCLLVIISLNFNLTSCSLLNSVSPFNSKSPITINAIAKRSAVQRADQKQQKPIYVTGKVIKIAPLLGNNAYQIQDETGKIWVVTTANLPSVGQKIFIKCKIKSQSSSSINQEIDELYLVEIEQLENP